MSNEAYKESLQNAKYYMFYLHWPILRKITLFMLYNMSYVVPRVMYVEKLGVERSIL